MNIREREGRRNIVGSMIENQQPKPRKPIKEPANGDKLQRAYYIDQDVVKRLKIAAAEEGVTASAIVEIALQEYLCM